MRGTLALVGGATVGAGLMYLLDPERGERRRAELSETLSCAVNDATERLGSVSLAEAAAVGGGQIRCSTIRPPVA